MKLRFIRSEQEVGDVNSYFFEPLQEVQWQAGQYLNLTLSGVPPVFSERLFTIASAPHEGYIQITTLVTSSPFKQCLIQLQTGDVIDADQLGGDFVWVDDGRKKLFLAGGIGITPFRSIILDLLKQGVAINAELLFGGRKDQQPFVSELQKSAEKDSTLGLTIVTDRRITMEDITQSAPDFAERLIYLAGPQTFVEGFGEYFMASGISRSQIKYDWFDGYFE